MSAPAAVGALPARLVGLQHLGTSQILTAKIGDALVRSRLDERQAVTRRAGDEGRLFGSVGTSDIAEAAAAAGHEVHKHEVRLAEGPLRQLGEFSIPLHLHADVDAHVTVEVVPEA